MGSGTSELRPVGLGMTTDDDSVRISSESFSSVINVLPDFMPPGKLIEEIAQLHLLDYARVRAGLAEWGARRSLLARRLGAGATYRSAARRLAPVEPRMRPSDRS